LQGGYQTVSLKTITTFGQFTLEGMPMDLQLECHEETIGFFHGEFDRKFPNLSRNKFRRPARRGFCDLYHQGKLTYIDIWNALNQHYKSSKMELITLIGKGITFKRENRFSFQFFNVVTTVMLVYLVAVGGE
jgi:hypothetical protein